MKDYILIICALSILGFLGEMIYRMVREKGYKSLKLLFMLPVYQAFAGIMSLFMLIPIFQKISFLPLFMLISGIVATLIELGFGIVYNKIMKLDIWNYNDEYLNIFGLKIPLSYMGQINVKHSIMYIILSPLVCYFSEIIGWLAK